MSYAVMVENIQSKFFNEDGNKWFNVTWETISNNDELLIAEYEERGYTDNDYNQIEDEEQKADYIRQSDAFYQIEEAYTPILSFVHLLQNEAYSEYVEKIYKNAPNIVVISDELDNQFLGLSAEGMDCSEELAYAYMIIDSCIPPGFRVEEDNSSSLNKEAKKELLEFIKNNKNN